MFVNTFINRPILASVWNGKKKRLDYTCGA